MDKHCTQRISYLSLSSLVGSRPQVVQRLEFLIIQMRSRARTGLKSKRRIENSFQAWRSAARGSHLLTILEFGMILCDVAGGSSGAAGLCISSNKSAKCQGDFFTVFHMQRGKEGREKKPHAALRQGRRQTGPPSSGCARQGSSAWDVFLCSPTSGSLWIKKPAPRQQTPVRLLPPQLRRRSLVVGRVQGAGLHRWACATAACCLTGWLRVASGRVPGPRWVVPPCGTSAGPRCSQEVSWLGGKVPRGNLQWGFPRILEAWEAALGTCLPSVQ